MRLCCSASRQTVLLLFVIILEITLRMFLIDFNGRIKCMIGDAAPCIESTTACPFHLQAVFFIFIVRVDAQIHLQANHSSFTTTVLLAQLHK